MVVFTQCAFDVIDDIEYSNDNIIDTDSFHSNFINRLVEKNVKIASVMIRATPIMETLTGFMIAGMLCPKAVTYVMSIHKHL